MIYPFAILNPAKLKQGEKSYMALGGGAMLTARGKENLERSVGATSFEFDHKTGLYDARFQVDSLHLEYVLNLFSAVGDPSMEEDPTRDIREELSGKEFPGFPLMFREEELEEVEFVFLGSVRQKPATGPDTSGRARAEMPTRRLFRRFELVMPANLFRQRMVDSPVVRLLYEDELATTDGGARAGRTRDGLLLQNNLF